MKPDHDEQVAYDREGYPLYRHPRHTDEPEEDEGLPPTVHFDAPPPSIAGSPDISPHLEVFAPHEHTITHSHDGGPEHTHHIAHEEKPAATEHTTPLDRHAESAKRWPDLNLSDEEYVITAVEKDPIGLFQIWAGAVALIATFGFIAFGPNVNSFTRIFMVIGFMMLSAATAIGAVLISRIYRGNRLFLTNESVIQETQHSLYSKHEQTASLASVADVRFRQPGFLATSMNYGTIEMTIEGDETDYQFSYVSSPKKVAAQIHNEVEKFKRLQS